MNESIFLAGYAVLVASVIIGWARYRYFDKAVQIILLLLSLSLCTEMAAYILVKINHVFVKGVIYHMYSIIEVILITAFFLESIKPYQHKILIVISIVFWLCAGLVNIMFFQSLDSLNTKFLMLESFSIITMSLYYIYWLLRNTLVENIFRYPHFWIAVLQLLLWSGTFFFWAFIRVLYSDRWPYIDNVITAHALLLLLTYCGFFFIFFYYPKNGYTIESN